MKKLKMYFQLIKAGGGNRTRIISLEGWGFTTKLRPHNVKNHYSAIIHYQTINDLKRLENSHSKNITGSRTRLMLSYGLGDAGTGLANAQFGFYLFPRFCCDNKPIIQNSPRRNIAIPSISSVKKISCIRISRRK